jgi:Flp pilus assembly pilin Flp
MGWQLPWEPFYIWAWLHNFHLEFIQIPLEVNMKRQEGRPMGKIKILAKGLLKEEAGMETAELAVVAALIIVAALGVWQLLGTSIRGVLTNLVNYLT